ncbi:dna damage checkpoint 1 [Gossypium arboreum]|uniref:Dna damage checkpoint 1 n=1 Tax=Gossypium arboreum TaxID=29729 RepID=A0A0B0PN60_GOSAR|nr:dna damage checkpoint 1 [Gossypium arboreum]
MGKQHGLDFLTRVDHTAVLIWQNQNTIYTGRPHTRAYLTALTTGVSHGRVPAEPKYNPIQKRPFVRVLKHSKAYLNTEGGKELFKESRLIHLRSRIHLQDERSPFNFPHEFLGFLYVLYSLFF